MTFGSFRRFPTPRTTERRSAATSVFRLGWHAAGEEINDRRLRLPIAVEPVIRNHSSGKNDADPQDQRKRAGNSGSLGRYILHIPRRHPAINAGVKYPYVQASQQQHDHFGAEENILIGAQRYRRKQERSTDDHDDESNRGPWQQAPGNFGYGNTLHRPAEETEIEHHGQAEE